MTARPRLCMFCGLDESFGEMDREHFVPSCLWAKGSRAPKMRPLPAHTACNRSSSSDNEYFRDVLVSQASVGSHPEVIRLRAGEMRRKLRNRTGAIVKTYKRLREVPQFTASGIYVGHAPVFEVDWPRMERVLQNIVRGIYYAAVGAPLPADCIIRVISVTTEESATRIRPIVDCMCDWQGFGDDVFACRYVTSATFPNVIKCLMRFYRKSLFFGEAIPADFFEQQSQRREES